MSHVSPSPADVQTFADPAVVRRAKRTLSASDRSMAHIIRSVGAFKPGLINSTFHALVGSIVHQQLSMKAARTIHGRLASLCPRKRITATAVAGLTDSQLRGAGLSRQKVTYLKSVARHFLDGSIMPRRLRRLPDEQVIESLVHIKGVGVWTAEMILIFNLKRTDIWPVDDLGLRQALKRWYRVPGSATRSRLVKAGQRFRPYRSIATWYLWSSLNTGIVPGFK